MDLTWALPTGGEAPVPPAPTCDPPAILFELTCQSHGPVRVLVPVLPDRPTPAPVLQKHDVGPTMTYDVHPVAPLIPDHVPPEEGEQRQGQDEAETETREKGRHLSPPGGQLSLNFEKCQ